MMRRVIVLERAKLPFVPTAGSMMVHKHHHEGTIAPISSGVIARGLAKDWENPNLESVAFRRLASFRLTLRKLAFLHNVPADSSERGSRPIAWYRDPVAWARE